MWIFEHNFVADKAKIRRRAVARQVFFTQYAAKFAEKTLVYACEDGFLGETEIEVPQDRDGTFEPKVVKKRQKDISGIEQKIISLYAKGMTTRQISDTIEEIYGFEVSDGMVSDITDRLLRLNKQRSVFPSDTALLKALYLATHEITKKWTMPLRNWGRVLGELEIMYPDRLN